jgi:hypothetical protein
MPNKKTESENLSKTGQSKNLKTTTESEENTSSRRRRRTAEDILAAAPSTLEEPREKTPSKRPKTLAEELAEEQAKPKVRAPRLTKAEKEKLAAEQADALAKATPEPDVQTDQDRPRRTPRVRPTRMTTESAAEPQQAPVQETPLRVERPRRERTPRRSSNQEIDLPVSFRARDPKPTDSKPTVAKPAKTSPDIPKPTQLSDDLPVSFRTRKPAGTTPKPKRKETDEVIDTDGLFTLSWRSADSAAPSNETAKRPLPTETDFNDSEERVTIAAWRSTEPKAPEREARTRNRRSRDADAPKVTAADAYGEEFPEANFRSRSKKAVEPPPVIVELPEPVAKETPRLPIERREEAAQVALHKNHPTIIKNKIAYSPIIFHADATTKDQRATVMEELKEATDQGLKIFSFRLIITVDPDTIPLVLEFADMVISAAVAIKSDLQIIPRISFQTPLGWKEKFPDAHYKYVNGETADPSVSDDAYWSEAETTLTAFIEGLRASKHADNIMGVHLDQNEWFLDEEDGYDISTASVEKFRRWLRMRYRNDIVSLRASWYDGSAEFDRIDIPDFKEGLGGEDFLRTDRKARRWVDYHLFISDEIVDRIAKMCYTVKKASSGDYLVGVSYGFTFEWSHPFSGHLSLGKLLRCNELDYAAGPSSYRDREPGGTAAFPFPVDSFALNGKLYMSEEDFRTPISGRENPNESRNPIMKTPQALESAHWRGVGGALAHEGGVIWMDSHGGGWLNSPGIWERGKDITNLLARRLSAGTPKPDVALFIDERSLAYLTDPRAFEILVQQTREALLRSGLNVGFYLLSDLAHRENFPECSLYLFVNAWDIRPEVRSAIKQRLQRDGKTLFWLYTAGLFEAGRDSLERVREVTGIALRPQPFNYKPGTTLINTRDEFSQHLEQSELALGGQLEPSFFAIPEQLTTILGEYTETGLPSFVINSYNEGTPAERWNSVFLGEPMVTPGLFRAMAQRNGAHVWSFDNDLVHANVPFVTVHCNGTGPRSLMLPDHWVAYHLDHQEYMPVENATVKFKAVDGSTHTFLVGTMGDVQAILNANPDDLLKVSEPIIRPDNTVEWNSVAFDVAIMKLDEWVEEAWSEEMADDLLIKPSMVTDMDESEDDESLAPRRRSERTSDDDRTSGRRRQRRRRSPEKQKGNESFGQTGVSVLFRKRD